MLALASVQPRSQDMSLGNEAIDNHARLLAIPVMKLTLKIRQKFHYAGTLNKFRENLAKFLLYSFTGSAGSTLYPNDH